MDSIPSITSEEYVRMQMHKALQNLAKAKEAEAKKIENGHRYVRIDAKTIVLRKK